MNTKKALGGRFGALGFLGFFSLLAFGSVDFSLLLCNFTHVRKLKTKNTHTQRTTITIVQEYYFAAGFFTSVWFSTTWASTQKSLPINKMLTVPNSPRSQRTWNLTFLLYNKLHHMLGTKTDPCEIPNKIDYKRKEITKVKVLVPKFIFIFASRLQLWKLINAIGTSLLHSSLQ